MTSSRPGAGTAASPRSTLSSRARSRRCWACTPIQPLTAYILFTVDSREQVKADNRKATNTEIISLIGQKWRALPDSEKKRSRSSSRKFSC